MARYMYQKNVCFCWHSQGSSRSSINSIYENDIHFESQSHAIFRFDSCLWQKPSESSNMYSGNTTTPPKTFDYTTIADRLRTVRWSNDSHQTAVVKVVYEIPTLKSTTKNCMIKGNIQKFSLNRIYFHIRHKTYTIQYRGMLFKTL